MEKRENTINLQVTMPDDSVLDKQVQKMLEAYGKEKARKFVQGTMSNEIQRIVDARIKDMKNSWFESSSIGKKIMEKITNSVDALAKQIGLDQNDMLDKLRKRVENAECYTEDRIQLMLNKAVRDTADRLGTSKEFHAQMRSIIADEVRLTYPVQIAQLIDTQQQDALRRRITELEAEVEDYKAKLEAQTTEKPDAE